MPAKTVTVADIARSIKMTPKNARRKLRTSVSFKRRTGKGKWVFPTTQRAQVVKALQA